ncbi:MAG TPA: 2OG-Fe(II) oxygenase, partial [Acidiphilium sp.]|nr:2OG-Fe(II) oxygenase [Acidiphilium sp.]
MTASPVVDFEGLAATEISADPFPHLVMRGFVRPDRLAGVVADLPPLGARGSFPIESVRLGSNAARLMEDMKGER